MADLSIPQSITNHDRVATAATLADSVLLIVCPHLEWSDGYFRVPNYETVIANMGALLQRYRAAGGSIVHVHSLGDTDRYATSMAKAHKLANVAPECAVQPGEDCVRHYSMNAFTGECGARRPAPR